MSALNIKELFTKRVKESLEFNNGSMTQNELNDRDNRKKERFFSLQEEDAGITEYLSECKGFNAIIKQRFGDFQVHEIDLEENVVNLTNFEVPIINTEPINEDVISSELWEELENVKEKVTESVKIDVTDFDKQKRKEIHKAIKWKYGSLLTTQTIAENDKKILMVSLGKSNERKSPWYSDMGSYLHFVLFKKNLDTIGAISNLASILRTKESNFTYSGTKDKRAITSQWISIWHLDAHRLNAINKSSQNIKMGNFVYKNYPLKLGDLKGNLFEIALRNVTETDENISNLLSIVKESGFINYFGLQRFGNCREIPTYKIGKALIKGDFKTAVELILKPRSGKMAPDLQEARRIWWESRDATLAFNCLRRKNHSIERQLLKGLVTNGKNAYVNALDCLPRNARLLYLHAYQSFIWNKIVSKRIKHFGKNVIEGDLILNNSQVEEMEASAVNTKDLSGSKSKVRCLTLEEVNNFKITDIVLPLPGSDILYPNNIIKDWYKELLEEDGLTSENFNQTIKKYSLKGTYRCVVQKMKDLTWNICYYSYPEEDLILSDLDKINQKTLESVPNSDTTFKAIVLKFILEPSTYATMALREILRIDTSSSFQAALNSYSNKRIHEGYVEEQHKKIKT